MSRTWGEERRRKPEIHVTLLPGDEVSLSGEITDPKVVKAVRRLSEARGISLEDALKLLLKIGVKEITENTPVDGQSRG